MKKIHYTYTEDMTVDGNTTTLVKKEWDEDDKWAFENFKSIFQLEANLWLNTLDNFNDYQVMLKESPESEDGQKSIVTEYWDGKKWKRLTRSIRVTEIDK